MACAAASACPQLLPAQLRRQGRQRLARDPHRRWPAPPPAPPARPAHAPRSTAAPGPPAPAHETIHRRWPAPPPAPARKPAPRSTAAPGPPAPPHETPHRRWPAPPPAPRCNSSPLNCGASAASASHDTIHRRWPAPPPAPACTSSPAQLRRQGRQRLRTIPFIADGLRRRQPPAPAHAPRPSTAAPAPPAPAHETSHRRWPAPPPAASRNSSPFNCGASAASACARYVFIADGLRRRQRLPATARPFNCGARAASACARDPSSPMASAAASPSRKAFARCLSEQRPVPRRAMSILTRRSGSGTFAATLSAR